VRPQDRLALLALGALWGAGFLFVRIAVPAFGPFALVAVRVLIAGALMLAWAAALGGVPPFWRRWREYLVLSALNVAIPFTLSAWAVIAVPASLAAIVMATIPLFTAPLAAVQLREQPSLRQNAGLVLGFVGVAVLIGLGPIAATRDVLAAIAALLGASLCYAIGGIYTARRFTGASPLESTIGQQFAAFALLLPFSLVFPPQAWPPLDAVAALLVLAVFATAIAYMLYFRLITSVGATRQATVAYLIPLFGAAWGVLFLDEPFGLATAAGMGIILLGVVLVTGRVGSRESGVGSRECTNGQDPTVDSQYPIADSR
jgi:drug/metabolite transporter (DMT)-like permease